MKEYPYGYCGMPCALCTRYYINGKSRCPGCSYDGYYTDVCKVHHCCCAKKNKHCGRCDNFPCASLGKMGEFSNLKTNHVKERTCEMVKSLGFSYWYEEYVRRAKLLEEAVEKYDDGRMKRYLCELFIQKDFSMLEKIMSEARDLTGSLKEKSKMFKSIVERITKEN